MLRVHFFRDNCFKYKWKFTMHKIKLLFKTFNPHKVCHNGIAARDNALCARFLSSSSFSSNSSMLNQISTIECEMKSDHYCLFVLVGQWTFINLIYVCVCSWRLWQSYRVIKLKIQSFYKCSQVKNMTSVISQLNTILFKLVKCGTTVWITVHSSFNSILKI